MSFSRADKLTEARESWEHYRRDDDFYAADAEERFLRYLARKYLVWRKENDGQWARTEVMERLSATGAAADDDRPWVPGVLADWIIHELVPRWHGPAAVAPAPAVVSSAAGGAAQTGPEPAPAPVSAVETGSGCSHEQQKNTSEKRKRDNADSDDDCVIVKHVILID